MWRLNGGKSNHVYTQSFIDIQVFNKLRILQQVVCDIP